MKDFEGLVTADTGGASGIGAATVRVLRERGAKVAVLDANAAPGGDLAVFSDVTDDTSVRTAVQLVAGELGRLDILVNCAGIGDQGDMTAIDDDEWLLAL